MLPVRLRSVSRQQSVYEIRIGHLHASLRPSLNARLHGIQAAQTADHDTLAIGVERLIELDADSICPVVVTADRGLRQLRLTIALPIGAALGTQSRSHVSIIPRRRKGKSRIVIQDRTASLRQRATQLQALSTCSR